MFGKKKKPPHDWDEEDEMGWGEMIFVLGLLAVISVGDAFSNLGLPRLSGGHFVCIYNVGQCIFYGIIARVLARESDLG